MNRKLSALNLIAAVLCLVMLALQFVPFWHCDGQSTSIQSYVWFPADHGGLDSYLAEKTGTDNPLNGMVSVAVLLLVCSAAGFVLCLIKRGGWLGALASAIGGLAGVWGYLTKATLQLGSLWGLHLVVCIALLAVGVTALFAALKK